MIRTTDLNMAPAPTRTTRSCSRASPPNVDTVMVDGRILVRDGKLTAVDAARLAREAAESARGDRGAGGRG